MNQATIEQDFFIEDLNSIHFNSKQLENDPFYQNEYILASLDYHTNDNFNSNNDEIEYTNEIESNTDITNNNDCINEIKTKEINEDNQKALKRIHFSMEEDQYLLSLIKKYGFKRWILISLMMKDKGFQRSERQCRDRYFHYLNPRINNNMEWSTEEDNLLIEEVKMRGRKWKEMEKIFKGRTEVSIRNRYNLLNRRMRKSKIIYKRQPSIMSDAFYFLDYIKLKKKRT